MLPGNTFLHKILLTTERRVLIYGVLANQKHLGGWSGRWEVWGGVRKRAQGREGVSGEVTAAPRGKDLRGGGTSDLSWPWG